MKFEIKSRFSASVLFECEAESLKLAVQIAVEKHANLHGADLRGANLHGADLYGADLYGANLHGANLHDIKDDYLAVLAVAKAEVLGLYKFLMEGKINGSTYTGDCACLVGSVAKIRSENYEKLSIDLVPNSSRPAEKWFLNIRKGDTPENSQVALITKEWTEDFMKQNGIKIPKMNVSWSEEWS